MRVLLFFMFFLMVQSIRYKFIIDYTDELNITEVTKIFYLDLPFDDLKLII